MKSIYFLMILMFSGLSISADTDGTLFCSEDYFDRVIQKELSYNYINFYRHQKESHHHWMLSYNFVDRRYQIDEHNTGRVHELDMVMNFDKSRSKLYRNNSGPIGLWVLMYIKLDNTIAHNDSRIRYPLEKTQNMSFSGLFYNQNTSQNRRIECLVGKPNAESREKTQFVYWVNKNLSNQNGSLDLFPTNKSVTEFFGCDSSGVLTQRSTTVTTIITETTEITVTPVPSQSSPEEENWFFWLMVGMLAVNGFLLIVFFVIICYIVRRQESPTDITSSLSTVSKQSISTLRKTPRA